MKRIIGIILFITGLVASLMYGYEAYENTESVKVLGQKLTFSSADWTPVIISAVVMVIGLIMIFSYQSKSRTRARK